MKTKTRHMQPMARRHPVRIALFLIQALLILPGVSVALEPGEILIVANQRVAEGVKLARYYADRRMVPETNLMLLDLPLEETCQRPVYEGQVAAPVRAFLESQKSAGHVRCIVLMYGMPLKVAPRPSVQAQRRQTLKRQEQRLKEITENTNDEAQAKEPSSLTDELQQVRRRLNQQKIESDHWASADSELSVVKAVDAPVGGWIENPFYLGFRGRPPAIPQSAILMVSRLDGPSAAVVKRIIDDAIAVEKTGLSGTAYFDARWPMRRSAPTTGYQVYDQAIHRAAKRLQDDGRIPAVINDADALFQPGQCPHAALYCGWYSLAKYVDAFAWQKGAVGYHIASSECTTLKKKK